MFSNFLSVNNFMKSQSEEQIPDCVLKLYGNA